MELAMEPETDAWFTTVMHASVLGSAACWPCAFSTMANTPQPTPL